MGTLRRLSKKEPSSDFCVSGMVKIGCASLKRGCGTAITFEADFHSPSTRFFTAYGSGLTPISFGSTVAQTGIEEVAVVAKDERALLDKEEEKVFLFAIKR